MSNFAFDQCTKSNVRITQTPTQPDLEIVLMPLQLSPMMDEATYNEIRQLVSQGVLGGGVFNTEDCQKTFDELSARGVQFLSPPQERPYGQRGEGEVSEGQ